MGTASSERTPTVFALDLEAPVTTCDQLWTMHQLGSATVETESYRSDLCYLAEVRCCHRGLARPRQPIPPEPGPPPAVAARRTVLRRMTRNGGRRTRCAVLADVGRGVGQGPPLGGLTGLREFGGQPLHLPSELGHSGGRRPVAAYCKRSCAAPHRAPLRVDLRPSRSCLMVARLGGEAQSGEAAAP